MPFCSIERAIQHIKEGRFLIVVDDAGRENEGDFIMAAEKVTPEAINFLTKQARGLICMPCEAKRLDELKIPPMVTNNTSTHKTNFAVSIGAKGKISTGISAYDRATTILTVIDPNTKPEHISMPGHIFPLRAAEGGVLKRAGHTEAAVDLARLAGLFPAGVICEIMNEDGTMARLPQLEEISQKFGIDIITIASLIEYRRKTEKHVYRVAEVRMPTRYGVFKGIAYKNTLDDNTHIALVKGEVAGAENVLVRVHSQCLTGEVFGSLRCDCGPQLAEAFRMLEEEGQGVLLYLRQEGRGIGLCNKFKAYELQDSGIDTVEANQALGFPPDLRDYGIGAQILADLGLSTIRLMTNNPRKIVGFEGYRLKVVERVPLITNPNPENINYLKTKKEKLAHLLEGIEEEEVSDLTKAHSKTAQGGS